VSTRGDRSLRVLHLITTLDRGGAEMALLHLLRRLLDAGVAPTVAYLKGSGELRSEFEAAGVPVHALGDTALGEIGAYGRGRRLVRKTRPDVVHTHLFKADCLGAAICGPRPHDGGPKLVSTKHNEDVYLAGDGARPRALRAVARRVAARADALVAITPGVRRFFEEHLGETAHAMRVITYGLPPAHPGDAAGFRREIGVPSATPLVVCLARFVEQKDHATLLDAFARVPGDGRLVLLGRGPLEEQIRAQTARDPRVIVHGFTNEPRHALTAADVVVLSSRHEGLGLALLEAAAHGVPVVATRVGGIPDVVVDGANGLLVPPGDPEALAAALSRVLYDAPLREKMGIAARATSHVAMEAYVHGHTALYGEMA